MIINNNKLTLPIVPLLVYKMPFLQMKYYIVYIKYRQNNKQCMPFIYVLCYLFYKGTNYTGCTTIYRKFAIYLKKIGDQESQKVQLINLFLK